MITLDLQEAAEFLKMNAEVLRRKAKNREIPGRKVGKRWIFIKEHLADWVSGLYPDTRRELRLIDGFKQQEAKKCQSTNAKIRGGSNSPHQTADEYNKLLGLK